MVTRKSDDEIARMRTAGQHLAALHDHLAGLLRPGITTAQLEAEAQAYIRDVGGRPGFQGPVEEGYGGFPAALCLSVDHEVVHGLPSERPLREGQLLTVDGGIRLDGVHSDAARTHVVGGVEVPPDVRRLLDGTVEALWAGIDACRVGNRVGDISADVESLVAAVLVDRLQHLTDRAVDAISR